MGTSVLREGKEYIPYPNVFVGIGQSAACSSNQKQDVNPVHHKQYSRTRGDVL